MITSTITEEPFFDGISDDATLQGPPEVFVSASGSRGLWYLSGLIEWTGDATDEETDNAVAAWDEMMRDAGIDI